MLPVWGDGCDRSQEVEDRLEEALHLARELLPTMYDLPSETVGESGLPDSFHPVQARLLSETCLPPRYPEGNFFMATDLYWLRWYGAGEWVPTWAERADRASAQADEAARRADAATQRADKLAALRLIKPDELL
jgi:hypothetical protein